MTEVCVKSHLVEVRSGNLAIYWILKGTKGAVTFHLLIHRVLRNPSTTLYKQTPVDICTHSSKPQYPDHKPYGLCEFCEGVCYGETDTIAADAVWTNIQDAPPYVDPSRIIWEELQRRYDEIL